MPDLDSTASDSKFSGRLWQCSARSTVMCNWATGSGSGSDSAAPVKVPVVLWRQGRARASVDSDNYSVSASG